MFRDEDIGWLFRARSGFNMRTTGWGARGLLRNHGPVSSSPRSLLITRLYGVQYTLYINSTFLVICIWVIEDQRGRLGKLKLDGWIPVMNSRKQFKTKKNWKKKLYSSDNLFYTWDWNESLFVLIEIQKTSNIIIFSIIDVRIYHI